METATELAVRLSKASRKKFWNVYSVFDWPEKLDHSHWFMPPELISLYGTPAWEKLDEEQRHKLSLFEMANLFSLTAQGEMPLVQGLIGQMYPHHDPDITEYLHHFLDEENKHMVMFTEFCRRYVGKVYLYKKIALPRKYEKGEEDVSFFIKALTVEEIGDYYNVLAAKDERVHPIVREINALHHSDEARHIVFGREVMRSTFEEHSADWSKETLASVREWIANYLRSSWADFYNPAVYRDAGIPDGYAAREFALGSEVCRAHRKRASAKLVSFLLESGILEVEPVL